MDARVNKQRRFSGTPGVSAGHGGFLIVFGWVSYRIRILILVFPEKSG